MQRTGHQKSAKWRTDRALVKDDSTPQLRQSNGYSPSAQEALRLGSFGGQPFPNGHSLAMAALIVGTDASPHLYQKFLFGYMQFITPICPLSMGKCTECLHFSAVRCIIAPSDGKEREKCEKR
jgi:hypothetical protein